MLKRPRPRRAAAGALLFALLTACTHTAKGDEDHSPFVMIEDALGVTEASLTEAREQDKLLLVILGANWCHDSKALASRLDDPALATVLDDHYETLVIGIGYFEQGFDVARRLGMEIYPHTPTVLIYDPQAGALVNLDDHHVWRDAARLSDEETLSYFEDKADPMNWSPAPDTGQSPVRAFESRQADRLRAAYAVLGPKLETNADDLNSYWYPVRDFRFQLTDDLRRLRQQERDAAASGAPFEPEWPTYELFPWEEGSAETPTE